MREQCVGWVLLSFMAGLIGAIGWFTTTPSSSESSSKPPAIVMPTTTPDPGPLSTPTVNTPNTSLVEQMVTWLGAQPEIPAIVQAPDGAPVAVQAGFPLISPPPAALNIEDYYNGYIVQVWAAAIPDDHAFIAVNYRYKQNVGGGTSAYAAHYGWDIDYHVVVIYETAAESACSVDTVQQTISGFQIDNGTFVVRVDGSVISVESYQSSVCRS